MNPTLFAADDNVEEQMEQMKKQSKLLLDQLEQFQKQKEEYDDLDPEDPDSVAIHKEGTLPSQNADVEKLFKSMQKEYANMDYSEVRQQVKEMMYNSHLKPVAKKVPKVIDFMTHLYRSPDALPRIVQVAKDRDKLKYVGLYMLATVILGWLFGKFFIRPTYPFTKRFRRGLVKFTLIWCARIGILVHFYGYYLGPSSTLR